MRFINRRKKLRGKICHKKNLFFIRSRKFAYLERNLQCTIPKADDKDFPKGDCRFLCNSGLSCFACKKINKKREIPHRIRILLIVISLLQRKVYTIVSFHLPLRGINKL